MPDLRPACRSRRHLQIKVEPLIHVEVERAGGANMAPDERCESAKPGSTDTQVAKTRSFAVTGPIWQSVIWRPGKHWILTAVL
jgi:hypothetical protein